MHKKGISRFISTHPDEDHIKGIVEFCDKIGIKNFYVVKNEATKQDKTDSFIKYCKLRDNKKKAFYVYKGCVRRWLNQDNEIRDSARINFLWPDVNNDYFKEALSKAKSGEEFNNISPILTYAAHNGVKAMWMGDMENEFLEKIKGFINWSEIDILFAPHHGRKSGVVSSDVLEKINPQIIVIGEAPSQNLNYYSGYQTITQNSAGDIVFECCNSRVDVYVSNSNYSVNYLMDYGIDNQTIGYYIGSFLPRNSERRKRM